MVLEVVLVLFSFQEIRNTFAINFNLNIPDRLSRISDNKKQVKKHEIYHKSDPRKNY